jgi:hypothetical protein
MSQGFKIANNDGQYAQGEHDISLDSLGRLVRLVGQDKLLEDIQKILFTEKNYFYSKYRTLLDDFIGHSVDINTIKTTLADRVVNSLVYLQFLQQEQAKYQTLDSAEVLETIVSVAVTYMGDISNSSSALTTFQVEAKVLNGAGQQLQVSTSFNTGLG